MDFKKTKLIPSLNTCLPKMTSGEKSFARCLESYLEEDYLCWYELPVGKKHQRYSDFIIFHPGRGLLLLEVKDWKLENIKTANPDIFELITPGKVVSVQSPLQQARHCCYTLVNQLKRDPQLIHDSGKHKGKLIFPFGYGVVFTKITRKQFIDSQMNDLILEHQVICKDEMTKDEDPSVFQKRLWDMYDYQFQKMVTLPQIDRIRWHIFPEIRINADVQMNLFDYQEEKKIDEIIPDIIHVMDLQQEQLARSLGEGHRVIHGVAGSGKTLILGYRCLHLANKLNKPILVLCFNITLASKLRSIIRNHNISHKVSVFHFHDWCGEMLRNYNVPRPGEGKDYPDRLVLKVIESVEKGLIPKGQYGALMIDEGHDFQEEWFKLVVGMVDPESDSLLLLYDDAQSIYSNKEKNFNFSLKSVGIKAQGRTTVLKVNYRNTNQILEFAFNFAKQYLSPHDEDDDHIPIIQPEPAGRQGPLPFVKMFNNLQEETEFIVNTFEKVHQKYDIPWSQMCVIFPEKTMCNLLQQKFSKSKIPVEQLIASKDKKSFRPEGNSVKLMTIHSSKGLEFHLVALCGVGKMYINQNEPDKAAKLLYVAMTRATEKLIITSHGANVFTRMLNVVKSQQQQSISQGTLLHNMESLVDNIHQKLDKELTKLIENTLKKELEVNSNRSDRIMPVKDFSKMVMELIEKRKNISKSIEIKTDPETRRVLRIHFFIKQKREDHFTSFINEVGKQWIKSVFESRPSTEETQVNFMDVFCFLSSEKGDVINPLNLDHWKFGIVPTSSLMNEIGGEYDFDIDTLWDQKVNKYFIDDFKPNIINSVDN